MFLTSVEQALLTTSLGAAFGIVGTIFGGAFQARRDDARSAREYRHANENWIRSERRRVYSDFIAQINRTRTGVASIKFRGTQQREDFDRLYLDGLFATMAEVLLVATRPVQNAADDARKATMSNVATILEGKPAGDAASIGSGSVGAAIGKFIRLAREELSIEVGASDASRHLT